MLPEIKRSHASQVSSLPSRRLVCLTISPGMMSPAPASSLITLSLSSPRRDGFPIGLPRATPGTVAAPQRRSVQSTDRRPPCQAAPTPPPPPPQRPPPPARPAPPQRRAVRSTDRRPFCKAPPTGPRFILPLPPARDTERS